MNQLRFYCNEIVNIFPTDYSLRLAHAPFTIKSHCHVTLEAIEREEETAS